MRNQRAGQATFIPLDTIQDKPVNDKFPITTLEGTVIHKSGLITGGRSTHATTTKWNAKDVEGGSMSFLDISH